MQGKWIGAVAMVAAIGVAEAGQRWVRLTLGDRSVVEGELVEFSGRTYRVRVGDRVEAIAEGDVTTLEFLDEAPAAARAQTVQQLLAARLRAAQASGALEAILGEQHLELEEWHKGHMGKGDRTFSALVYTTIAVEGGLLVVETEVFPRGGQPHLFDADTSDPYRLRSELELGSGALVLHRIESQRIELGLRADGDVLRAEVVQLDPKGLRRGAEVERPRSGEQLDEQTLYFVFAPLLGSAATERLTCELLVPKAILKKRGRTQLTPLPGLGEVDGRAVRRLELQPLRGSGLPKGERGEVAVLAAGPQRGRVQRILRETFMTRAGEDSELSSRTTALAISPADFAAKLEAWGLEAPQPLGAGDVGEVQPPEGEAALAAAAAKARGGERWFASEANGVTTLTSIQAEAGATLRVSLRSDVVGGLPGDAHEFVRQAAGLQSFVLRARTSARSTTAYGTRTRADRIVVRSEQTKHGVRDVRQAAEREYAFERALLDESELPVLAPHLAVARTPVCLIRRDGGRIDRGVLLPAKVERGEVRYEGLRLTCPPGLDADRAWLFVQEHRSEELAVEPPTLAVWLRGEAVAGWSAQLEDDARLAWQRRESTSDEELGPFDFVASARGIDAAEAQRLRADPERQAAGRARSQAEREFYARLYLYTVRSAQRTFRKIDAEHDGELDYAESMDELARCQLIEATERYGYRFRVVRAADAPSRRFVVLAEPVGEPGERRWLAVDPEGKLWGSPGPIAVDANAQLPAGLEPLE